MVEHERAARILREAASFTEQIAPAGVFEEQARRLGKTGYVIVPLATVQSLIRDLDGLRSESQGLAGYHLNGVVAQWDEFEEWFAPLEELRSMVDAGEVDG